MKLAQAKIENQPFDILQDFEKGFARGSIWQNLYIPYKYETTVINTNSEKEQIEHLLMVYNFASIELSLYLCTHKDNAECREYLTKVNKEKEKICYYYENKFNALTSTSPNNVATYIENPWPWERS